MITAKNVGVYAAECKLLASSIAILTQRSLEQSIMALNWEALAEQIDRENAQATLAAFSPLGALDTPGRPEAQRWRRSCSVGSQQVSHRELNLTVGKLPPAFNDSRVSGMRRLIENFASSAASRFNRQRECL
jgi:hypothetical protein